MKISSDEVPQANDFEAVLGTVRAVAAGALKDSDISRAIKKGVRQGRYYRKAAEILGFIQNQSNRATLTPFGAEFLQTKISDQNALLTRAVFSMRFFQRVVPFLESHSKLGSTKGELTKFIVDVTAFKSGPNAETAERRASSVINWLRYIGLLNEKNKRYRLGTISDTIDPIKYQFLDEPLAPRSYELKIYEDVAHATSRTIKSIEVLINHAAIERANKAHQALVNMVASRVRRAGSIPRFNHLVDLSATIDEIPYFFEMKSNTSKNFHFQFRRAISQLYEYRYLQGAMTAKLVIIMEQPPTKSDEWMLDYAIKDRDLLVAWDGDGQNLYTPSTIADDLSFLHS